MAGVMDVLAVAEELRSAYARKEIVGVPPSGRVPGFDLDAGYAVEAALVRMRRESGHATVGRKVGFANKAVWRALKLETLVWAHMYDDTVQYAGGPLATLSLSSMRAPKIEPEIVFRMKAIVPAGAGAEDVLGAVEWIALGFEIVDGIYGDAQFQPADFLAAYGFHAALVVGEPRPVEPASIPALADALSRFTVRLLCGDQLAAEGGGKNVLRSPALCLAELAAASARRTDATPLSPGEIVSSGSLAEAPFIAAGQTWSVVAQGLDVPALTVYTC